MQKLVSNAPKTFKKFKNRVLLPKDDNLVITRLQVATILSCVFFGLFNYHYLTKGYYSNNDYPDLIFINIFVYIPISNNCSSSGISRY